MNDEREREPGKSVLAAQHDGDDDHHHDDIYIYIYIRFSRHKKCMFLYMYINTITNSYAKKIVKL